MIKITITIMAKFTTTLQASVDFCFVKWNGC